MVASTPTIQPGNNYGLPPAASERPLMALTLKTFNVDGSPVGSNQPPAPTFNAGLQSDAFQRQTPLNPSLTPQQNIMNSYNEALNARATAMQQRNAASTADSMAAQKLNEYLQEAGMLNSQGYQNQLSSAAPVAPAQASVASPLPGGSGNPNGFQPPVETPTPAAPNPVMPQDPNAAMQEQQAQQQLQQMQDQQQLQQAAVAQQQQEAAAAQQQMMQQAQQEQMQQAQQNVAPQPAMPQPAQPGQDQNLSFASTEELNRMISQGQTMQDKVNAMAELSVRGQGSAETYELLKREAMADTSTLPPGEAKQKADYIRQTSLWTLGILNAMQNAAGPTQQLPGLREIDQIISSPKDDPSVDIAAIQALQVINRPTDPTIKNILKKASKNPNQDVQALAKKALAGESIAPPGNPTGSMPVVPPGTPTT